jgi:hypothetical protein
MWHPDFGDTIAVQTGLNLHFFAPILELCTAICCIFKKSSIAPQKIEKSRGMEWLSTITPN